MNILKRIQEQAQCTPDRTAVRNGAERMTYGELWAYSDALAGEISRMQKNCLRNMEKEPIAVYGHKSPWMLVCFLACVKSGHAYCPIDRSVPDNRTEMILGMLSSEIVLVTEAMSAQTVGKQVWNLEHIRNIVKTDMRKDSAEKDDTAKKDDITEKDNTGETDGAAEKSGAAENTPLDDIRSPRESDWVTGDDTWYIIFTSGSTGTPKGVQISADCLNHYLDWSVGLGTDENRKQGQVFLNQAPFSFDLSVMDLYTCLACGGTLYCLNKTVQSDYRLLMQALGESKAGVWVSTPSFAEICLSEKSFNQEWMQGLELFLFCGETLANRTVKKLQERFPQAVIVNTYGPTESTVAVTEVIVTPEMAEQIDPLPVGRAKPGTVIEIRDENGAVLPDGEKGEITILGNTVSTGYYRRADLTEKAFFAEIRRGKENDETMCSIRGYRTGDRGYLRDGMLFYCGRMDLQIKLHGYRIELEDIENNLRRLPGVEHAVVLPNQRDGKVKSLTAYLVESKHPAEEKAETEVLRNALKQYLPDYMIPKKFVYLDVMPMTNNGKADRKKLGGNNG